MLGRANSPLLHPTSNTGTGAVLGSVISHTKRAVLLIVGPKHDSINIYLFSEKNYIEIDVDRYWSVLVNIKRFLFFSSFCMFSYIYVFFYIPSLLCRNICNQVRNTTNQHNEEQWFSNPVTWVAPCLNTDSRPDSRKSWVSGSGMKPDNLHFQPGAK